MVEGSSPSAPIRADEGDIMPRTKKLTPKKTTRTKRTVTRKTTVSKPSPKPEKKSEHMYFGYSYDTWVNIILVVSVILILGILAGVGSLVQHTNSEVPSIVAANTYIANASSVRLKAGKVLDIAIGQGNYNITGVGREYGLYRIELTVNTAKGPTKGVVYVSPDNRFMFLREVDMDAIIAKYGNKS